MLRLLFITTRNPLSPCEQDGGSIFAAQAIRQLAPRSQFDVLFLRNQDPDLMELPTVNNAYFLPPDMNISNRFVRRLATALLVENWLKDRINDYHAFLVQHVSSGFGIVRISPTAGQKMIVFPMFTGESYRRSGENVPLAYIEEETKVLQSTKLIICPSRSEALDLIQAYSVNKTYIQFAPFGINLETFTFLPRSLSTLESDLLYVATIKKQKNQLECLAILERLLAHGIKARVHLVGIIGDYDYYKIFLEEVNSRKLHDQVVYHGVLAPREIVQIALTCTFSISPSRWETFGIAIVESLAMGLPVVAYEDIECLWENFQPGLACIGVPRCADEMARQIAVFHKNPDDYKWRSDQARNQVAHFDDKKVFQGIFNKIEKFTEKKQCERSNQ